jgi:integrase
MSIYPERDRKGSFTGRWIKEQTVAGNRVRTRHASLEEARSLRETEKVNDITLGDLHEQAEALLWKGTKDELQSCQRWRTCLEILGRQLPLRAVRRPQLETLARALGAPCGSKPPRSPKTVNRHLATVSRALRWAHECDIIEGMPVIPWQKETEGRKLFLPEDQTEAFLTAIPEPYRFAAEVLLLTGMRVSELLTLQEHEVSDDVVQLTATKTGRPRSIPLPTGYGVRLSGWLGRDRVNYRPLLEHVAGASERACGFRLTPHALRHTTATRLISRGVPSLTVAEIMGHSSLATTRQYVHHDVESLRKALASLHTGF